MTSFQILFGIFLLLNFVVIIFDKGNPWGTVCQKP